MDKAWFNKYFKKGGSYFCEYEFGLCVNKKGQVVLIYTGDMFGAEQMLQRVGKETAVNLLAQGGSLNDT